MSSAEVPKLVSVDEYLTTEERVPAKHEYVDGWVRAMTGASLRHNMVAGNCFVAFKIGLKGKPCQPFGSDTKLRIRGRTSTRFYYPDLQVVCKSNAPTAMYQDHPVLIIEALSPSTRQYDLDEKLNAYLQIPSLECYIAVEQHQPFAIVHRRTDAGFLREVYEGVESNIELPLLGCSLSLRDIYEGVEFTPTCVQEPEPEEYEIGKASSNFLVSKS